MIAIVPGIERMSPELIQILKDGLMPGDWLTIGNGTVSRPADPVRLQARAELLAQQFPQCAIYAFTSGVTNIETISAAAKPPVVGVFYDYEPNYANEPEFSFDPAVTFKNLSRATAAARAHGIKMVAYLTGQGLFHPDHTWNYAGFREAADVLVIQSQASLKHGRWGEALDRLTQQFGENKPPVQITVTPGLPNAVDIPTAIAAYDELVRRGFNTVVLWWNPTGVAELKALLNHRRGLPPTA